MSQGHRFICFFLWNLSVFSFVTESVGPDVAAMEMQMFCLSVQKEGFIVASVLLIMPPVHSRELNSEMVKGR